MLDIENVELGITIAYLEENGYLECDSQLKKRYNSAFKLTAKGLEIAKQIALKIDSVLKFASDGLSEDKRKNMYEGLILISNNLDNYCDKYEGEE